MHVSVVIPTKNEEHYLPRLLSSLREQTLTDFEIIVADAWSTDRTRDIATSVGARVVDGGLPGVGRNRGADVARGTYVFFFDADVALPHPFFLEDCLREIQERNLDVATCRVRALDGHTIDHMMHGAYNAYTLVTERLLPHAPGFCLLVRREAHEKNHGFDEEVVFAEDHDYVRRAKHAGFAFGILRKHKIDVSLRRLHKDGRMHTAVKYVFAEIRMLTVGPFKHRTPFAYEWGKFKKEK